MRPSNSLIMNAVAANTNQASKVVWSDDIVRISVQLVPTGSATGTYQVQASNDQATGLPPNQYIPTNWITLFTGTVAGTGVYNSGDIECSYEYLRVVYTDATGGAATGTITTRLKAMGL